METKTKSQPKTKATAKTDESSKAFECQCGKQYKFETHLNKHKNICKAVSQTPIQEAKESKEPKEEKEEETGQGQDQDQDQSDDDEPMDENSFIMKLVKENQELKRVILHQHNKLLEQDEKFLECFKMFIAQILSAAAAEDQANKNKIVQSGEPTTKNT